MHFLFGSNLLFVFLFLLFVPNTLHAVRVPTPGSVLARGALVHLPFERNHALLHGLHVGASGARVEAGGVRLAQFHRSLGG